ncbi:MAG: hypothetical protein HQ568_11790 [Calditrichaeota bacterium]|nr:hypothetical protein [Calditrichota bacterium]
MSDKLRQLGISVGMIDLLVESCSDRIFDLLQKRYSAYIHDKSKGLSLKLSPLTGKRSIETAKVKVRMLNDTLIAERGDFRLRIYDNDAKAEGELLTGSVTGLTAILKFTFASAAINLGGFFMHAGATSFNGQGWLFPGRSGAGKSTLVKMLNSHHAFADEMPLVSCDEDNWLVHATPFASELSPIPKPASAPIEGIMFLEKGKPLAKREITSSESLHRIMQNIIGWGLENKIDEVLSLAENLSTSCRSYILNWQQGDDPNLLFLS